MVFVVYDLLEQGGEDIRALPQHERRTRLEALLAATPIPVSPAQAAPSWLDFARLRELLALAISRLPTTGHTVKTEDAVVIISAVMDGLWLDYCLSPTRTSRERALELCCLTARRLIPPA